MVDLRPRIVFTTPVGVVVAIVDPATLLTGTVSFPSPVGNVPYDIAPGFPVSTAILHVPSLGDVSIPMDLSAIGSGAGDGTVNLPGWGAVPYTVTLGDPGIPPDQLANLSGLLTGPLIIGLLILAGGYLLLKK